MTTWINIKPSRGRERKTTFRVIRSRGKDGKHAAVIFPIKPGDLPTRNVSIMYHGRSALAYRFHAAGQFRARDGGKQKSVMVVIPAGFVPRIPFGTTECTVTRDGDLYVLDLSQFDGVAQESAE